MELVRPCEAHLTSYVDALTRGWSPDNLRDAAMAKLSISSQRVIAANGGVLAEEFIKPPAFGGKPGLRYRIHFS